MPPEIVYEFEGRQIHLPLDKEEITIGRDDDNDVVLKVPSVSRKHAKIYRDGTAWRVADLGSLNGTRVNDLSHTDTTLRDGDRIFVHNLTLVFRDVDSPGNTLPPGAALVMHPEQAGDLRMQTVVQSAVDFSALVARPPDVQRLQKLLTIVTRASEAILASATPDDTLQKVLELVFEQLPVERGLIMLWDEQRQDLVVKCVKHRSRVADSTEIRFSRTIAEKVFREKVAVLTSDAQTDDRFAAGASIFELNIRSAIAAPIWSGDHVEGLMYVDTLHAQAFDNFDLDLLSALGNHVAIALEHSRLQRSVLEQQLVRRRLERYHSPAVVELIAANRNSAQETLMVDEREVTVLFADVVEFTKRCECMEPREIAELLNRYFSVMTEKIFLHQGTLDKFIGDCLMAVFGAPLQSDDHAVRAMEAALDMRDALAALNEPLPPEARLQFRVGMHSGRVVAGDIGSARRSDYTVLGATVNLAARLESTVAAPGQIVVSQATASVLCDLYEVRGLGEHKLKGMSRPVGCFEVLGRSRPP